MSKITKKSLRKMIKEETEYQLFFRKALDKYGVESPEDLDDDKKKEFFNYVDNNWDAENETDVDETLEPVSPAAGNPLKRVKAKKRDQILAIENKIRKIVREELTFLMFDEVPSTRSRRYSKNEKKLKGKVDQEK